MQDRLQRLSTPTGPRTRTIKRLWLSVTLAGCFLLGLFTWNSSSFGASDDPEDAALSHALISLEEIRPPAPSTANAEAFTLENHNRHPDNLFQPYLGGSTPGVFDTPHVRSMMHPLQDLFELYVLRQGRDDNFTIRLMDERTNELLELHVLEEERLLYQLSGEATWEEIDKKRREQTTELLDRYEEKGYPRDALTVRWGRADQMVEARERKTPVMEYELQLADYLDMSLLVTELGTVETFNNDRLVSSVGARGRYQMMPYHLRNHDINQYTLSSAAGVDLRVREEWHPLLTMEAAFLMVKSHVNAFGSEIAGISAYHTGPGNIYGVLRTFLANNPDALTYPHTVLDGYMWGLTTGFEAVSSESSFRTYSRGYVPSAYGALRATQHIPVDTSKTMRAERVQLAPGQSLYLSELLDALAPTEEWDWQTGFLPDSLSRYEQFRELNPHFDLPEPDSSEVPSRGDIRLVDKTEGDPVRFFLPLGATDYLSQKSPTLLDGRQTFRFDQNSYAPPAEDAYTRWDREYDALVERIARFGFTSENKEQLEALAERFETLADETPTHYRQAQHYIIQEHLRLWEFSAWDELAEITEVAQGNRRLAPKPVVPFDQRVPETGTLLSGNH